MHFKQCKIDIHVVLTHSKCPEGKKVISVFIEEAPTVLKVLRYPAFFLRFCFRDMDKEGAGFLSQLRRLQSDLHPLAVNVLSRNRIICWNCWAPISFTLDHNFKSKYKFVLTY